jgi:hypothetical protein
LGVVEWVARGSAVGATSHPGGERPWGAYFLHAISADRVAADSTASIREARNPLCKHQPAPTHPAQCAEAGEAACPVAFWGLGTSPLGVTTCARARV